HTRSDRDWSSDVCSSDLIDIDLTTVPTAIFALSNEAGRILSTIPQENRPALETIRGTGIVPAVGADGSGALILHLEGGGELTIRSEERRVGKEGRCRGGV